MCKTQTCYSRCVENTNMCKQTYLSTLAQRRHEWNNISVWHWTKTIQNKKLSSHRQVYLLAPMPHTQLTISHCTQLDSECDHQTTSINRYLKELCYTDRQLSAVSTYTHDETQTPSVQFVSYILYKQVHSKSTLNWTNRVWVLVHSITSINRCRWDQQRSTIDGMLTSLKDGQLAVAKFFQVQSCECKNMSHEPYNAPFGGSFCHHYAMTVTINVNVKSEVPFFIHYGNMKYCTKCIKKVIWGHRRSSAT